MRLRLTPEKRAQVARRARPGEGPERSLVSGAIGDDAPLSDAQRRLWFLYQLDPGGAAYNVPATLEVEGRLDVSALERALRALTERHAVLRTRFVVRGDEPVQHLGLALEAIDVVDVSSHPRPEEVATRIAAELAVRPFDLTRGPPLRLSVLRLRPDRSLIAFCIHHIVFDGWSMAIFVRDLTHFYQEQVGIAVPPLPRLTLQYADFAAWQRRVGGGETERRQIAFWQRRLASLSPLELRTDLQRPAVKSYRGGNVAATLPADVTRRLRAVAASEDATLFMGLLAGFFVLLHRYAGQTDLAVGTPIANRRRADLEELIGFFVNTLVIRTEVERGARFRDVLQAVRRASLDAYENQDVPFEKLVELLAPDRDPSHTPLVQAMFMLQNNRKAALALPGLAVSIAEDRANAAKFDLMLNAVEDGAGVELTLIYDADLFRSETAAALLDHYVHVLRAASEDPSARIASLPMLAPEERTTMLERWNATEVARDPARTLVGMFEACVARAPDAIATVFGARALTYRALNRRVNQLAHHLRRVHGVRRDEMVDVMVEGSDWLVVAFLAVLKAGGAYLPLDPAYPADRLAVMMREGDARVNLTTEEHAHRFEGQRGVVVLVDRAGGDEPATNPPRINQPDDLAYIIYTSGSTGRPKGILQTHRCLSNFVDWQVRGAGFEMGLRILQCAAASFDVAVQEILHGILSGGTLHMVGERTRKDLAALRRYIVERGIELVDFPFSVITHLLDDDAEVLTRDSALRHVISAGEPWSVTPAIGRLLDARPWLRLHNHYGPSETHMLTSHSVSVEAGNVVHSPPLGRPIWNMRGYVLDASLEPVPVGVVGELYIAGTGLSRGYMSRRLSAAKLVPNPFADGQRLYKTEDFARWTPDGTLVLLGRIDGLVKIRGYRVELQEVESALMTHPDVYQCVVIARSIHGVNELVAYVAASRQVRVAALRAHLGAQVPDFMVPRHFVQMEAIPRSPNGKADRAALPEPDRVRPDLDVAYDAPRSEEERLVAAIWEGVLELERVGIRDDFFSLGGHSLLATHLVAEIERVFQVALPLAAVFQSPTVEAMTQEVTRLRSGAILAPLPSVPERDLHPLAPGQRRLLFLERLAPGQGLYSLGGGFTLRGLLDLLALEGALNDVVARHAALRTRIVSVPDLAQRVAPTSPAPLRVIDLEGRPERMPELCARELRAAFDLERGPLFRASALRLGAELHVLLLNMHHVIGDAWSTAILLREIGQRYEERASGSADAARAEDTRYLAFAALQDEVRRDDLLFCADVLRNAPPPPLPFHPRARATSQRGASVSLRLSSRAFEALGEVCKTYRCTPFMGMLTVLAITLHRYGGQRAFGVATPVSGRGRSELEEVVGFFVNTIVVRLEVDPTLSFRALLERCRASCIAAFARQHVPFEQVVDALREPGDSATRDAPFRTMFLMQDRRGLVPRLRGLTVGRHENPAEVAKFDMTFAVEHDDDDATLTLEYRTDLLDAGEASAILAELGAALEELSRAPETPVVATRAGSRSAVLAQPAPADERALPSALHDWVAAAARAAPDGIAVSEGTSQISYRRLVSSSRRAAHALRAAGVDVEGVVAVIARDGLRSIVAQLAVLAAGAAFVTIEPEEPAERRERMLSVSGARVVLFERGVQPIADGRTWLPIETLGDAVTRPARLPRVSEDNLAYVVFTSGSTGVPKGVAVTHRGFVGYLRWFLGAVEARGGSILHGSTRFDLSFTALFAPLVTGGTVVCCDTSSSPLALLDAVARRPHLGFLKLTPTHLALLTSELARDAWSWLRCTVVLGGEVVDRTALDAWSTRAPHTTLINEYGATENVVGCVARRVGPEDGLRGPVPVGAPISGAVCHLVDPAGAQVVAGAAGELLVGGRALARGYVGDARRTAERFVPDDLGGAPGARVYVTGDVAIADLSGALTVLGRTDRQIKHRGVRIELGEIEAVLRRSPEVGDAFVRLVAGRLVGYVVPRDGAVDLDALHAGLATALPAAMVPAALVQLDRFPLLAHGKIDEAALPAPVERASAARRPPTSATERALASAWAAVLGVADVDATDDFFALGGSSLSAMRMLDRASEALGKDISLRLAFDTPSLEGLARAIDLLPARASRGPAPLDLRDARALLERADEMSDEEVSLLLEALMNDED